MSGRMLRLSLVLALALCWTDFTPKATACGPAGVIKCKVGSPDCNATGCVKVPTSLLVWTGACDAYGYLSAGGNCGTKSCNVIFRCPCGPPLVSQACSDEPGQGCPNDP